jgi:hypothetical protein
MRVGVIAGIAPVVGSITLLVTMAMPGPASAQGTPGAPPGAPGLGPQTATGAARRLMSSSQPARHSSVKTPRTLKRWSSAGWR